MFLEWNFDISAAPKGKYETVVKTTVTKDGKVEKAFEEYSYETVILQTCDNEVVKSRWLPANKWTPNGRWDGFPENAKSIVAWMEWPKPTLSRINFVDDVEAQEAANFEAHFKERGE